MEKLLIYLLAVTSITALFMATGAQIIATASIINVVTGFDFKTAAIVSTAVVIVYTMFGGFKSVTAANLCMFYLLQLE